MSELAARAKAGACALRQQLSVIPMPLSPSQSGPQTSPSVLRDPRLGHQSEPQSTWDAAWGLGRSCSDCAVLRPESHTVRHAVCASGVIQSWVYINLHQDPAGARKRELRTQSKSRGTVIRPVRTWRASPSGSSNSTTARCTGVTSECSSSVVRVAASFQADWTLLVQWLGSREPMLVRVLSTAVVA